MLSRVITTGLLVLMSALASGSMNAIGGHDRPDCNGSLVRWALPRVGETFAVGGPGTMVSTHVEFEVTDCDGMPLEGYKSVEMSTLERPGNTVSLPATHLQIPVAGYSRKYSPARLQAKLDDRAVGEPNVFFFAFGHGAARLERLFSIGPSVADENETRTAMALSRADVSYEPISSLPPHGPQLPYQP